MTIKQVKYLLALLGLVAALFASTVGNGVAIQQIPVSVDSISAFLSVIVISLVITAQSNGTLRQDLLAILCALAGLVVYTAIKSAFTSIPGFSGYLALTLGAMASALIHYSMHYFSQNQST